MEKWCWFWTALWNNTVRVFLSPYRSVMTTGNAWVCSIITGGASTPHTHSLRLCKGRSKSTQAPWYILYVSHTWERSYLFSMSKSLKCSRISRCAGKWFWTLLAWTHENALRKFYLHNKKTCDAMEMHKKQTCIVQKQILLLLLSL